MSICFDLTAILAPVRALRRNFGWLVQNTLLKISTDYNPIGTDFRNTVHSEFTKLIEERTTRPVAQCNVRDLEYASTTRP
jgi:hypothetical protein